MTNFVTPTWFDVYGIGLRAGRDFDHRDAANTLPVAIVNETFVRKFLAGRHAIGETVQGLDSTRRTVVGVAADAVFGRSLRDTVPPMKYVPLDQSTGLERLSDTGIRISVRSTSEIPGSVARNLGTALAAVNRDLTFSFRPLRDYVDTALARERLVAMLSGFFGVLAVFLAAIGLYGVTAYTATQRRAESAIRIALGAQRSSAVGVRR